MDNRKLELVTDFYELTMSNCYFAKNIQDTIAYFDVFFRKIPDEGGYVIFAGLEQVIDYVKNLKFDEDDISYLKGLNKFSDELMYDVHCSTGCYQRNTLIEKPILLGTYRIPKNYMKSIIGFYYNDSVFQFPKEMEIQVQLI